MTILTTVLLIIALAGSGSVIHMNSCHHPYDPECGNHKYLTEQHEHEHEHEQQPGH